VSGPITAADVAAWLDAHPEEHAAVLAAVRHAPGPWGFFNGGALIDHPFTGRSLGSVIEDEGIWRWRAGRGSDLVEGTASSREEAREFIRAALRLRGWTVS
jgi:hypothetical protein